MNVKRVERTDDEWRSMLSSERFRVLRRGGTEPAHSGQLTDVFEPGLYVCAGCESPLFTGDAKFESRCGWPSFWVPVAPDVISEHVDDSFGMHRTEVRCAACGGHLGHVFTDGPPPTGLRYCINSLSLEFQPAE